MQITFCITSVVDGEGNALLLERSFAGLSLRHSVWKNSLSSEN